MSSSIPEAERQNLWHNISGIKQWQTLDNFVVIFGDHGDHAEMELTFGVLRRSDTAQVPQFS
jgi:hypothetical protein